MVILKILFYTKFKIKMQLVINTINTVQYLVQFIAMKKNNIFVVAVAELVKKKFMTIFVIFIIFKRFFGVMFNIFIKVNNIEEHFIVINKENADFKMQNTFDY